MCAFTHIVRFPFFRKLDVPGSEKIAAFDLDGTIVATDSGRDLPVNSSDWRLYNPDVPNKMKRCLDEGFSLVIFSNQGTIKSALDGKAASNSKNRVDQILLKIGLPVQVFFATQKDEYRKPNTGMWEFMVSHCNCGLQPDLSKSFYVGDFAGRSNDKADSDREFARRVGIKFLTPEEFFGCARGLVPLPLPFAWSWTASAAAKAFAGCRNVRGREGRPVFSACSVFLLSPRRLPAACCLLLFSLGPAGTDAPGCPPAHPAVSRRSPSGEAGCGLPQLGSAWPQAFGAGRVFWGKCKGCRCPAGDGAAPPGKGRGFPGKRPGQGGQGH
mmetsp:Transcript_24779/g.58992  ORF Transcript_24779/g.58992 Transcript_24779/m.58992 type:complete len:327 (+) Transcript_24779:447-1427(+)